MDIEEIKCALCSQVYNQHERMPILLPDCGHSFCHSCIQDCFELLKIEQKKAQAQHHFDQEDEVENGHENDCDQTRIVNDVMAEGLSSLTKNGASSHLLDNSKDYTSTDQNIFIEDLDQQTSLETSSHQKQLRKQKSPLIKQQPRLLLFKCPEDDIECSIQNPDSLPKNFALLKIVQRTLESEADKKKHIVVLKYEQEQKKFVASKKEDKSLARFLSNQHPSEKVSPGAAEAKHNTAPQQQTPPRMTAFTPQKQMVLQEPLVKPQMPLIIENCKQHGRPLELICVDDKQRVCAQCALFGSHKGHDVRQEEDVAKEIQLKVEVLMEMYQAMHQQCIDLNGNPNYDKYYSLFKKRQQEVKSQIQDKFKEWRKQLRAVEMKIIDQLYMNYGQFEDRFQQAMNQNKRMVNDGQAWMDKAKQSLDEYTQKTMDNPTFIAYDMLDCNQADDILNHGEIVLDRNDKQKGFPSLLGLDSQYNQVKVAFEPNFDKRLLNLAHIIGYGQQQQSQLLQHQQLSTQHTENSGEFTASQSFLPHQLSFTNEEADSSQNNHITMLPGGLNISNISFNEPTSPINDKSKQIEEVKVQQHQQQMNESTGSQDSQILHQQSLDSSGNQSTLQTSKGSNTGAQGSLRRISMINKKQSTTSIGSGTHAASQPPPAQHQMVPSQTSTTDVKQQSGAAPLKKKLDLATMFKTQASPAGELDLSNKNFSDMHAGDIAKCLKSHSMHVKSLSLAKNRLTDEGVGQIVRAVCDTQIEHLDLQGNKISEKSVDGIVGCLKTNKHLKVLDLSNNGIGSRLMKNKLKNALPHIEVLL